MKKILFFTVTCCVFLALVGCTSEAKNEEATTKLRLITYDSFPKKDTSLNEKLEVFEKATNSKVEIVNAGDTGQMVNKAILTSGNPEGDVLWGIDNTFLSKAIDKKVFESYKSKNISNIDSEFTKIVKNNEVTPVDYGDVCVNYDINYFKTNKLEVPTTLKDLTKPEYKGLLAVQDPSSSSPGLAFLLASIDEFGETKWKSYWKDLKDNDVKVSQSWDNSYYELFSGSSGKGDYPLVVSYATSPVAEVVFSDPQLDSPPTGSIDSTCFRQVEFAGVLRGTKHKEKAQQLIDFLTSESFQKEIPLNLFVFPARENVILPEEFIKFAKEAEEPYTLSPKTIEKNRDSWIKEWNKIVIR